MLLLTYLTDMFVQDLEASVPGLRRSLRIREMRRTSKG